MADKKYNELETVDKIRINAAIMHSLARDTEGFSKAFMNAIDVVDADFAKKSLLPFFRDRDKGRDEAFQQVLNTVRNEIAKDLTGIPQATRSGLILDSTLEMQSGAFRAARDLEAKDYKKLSTFINESLNLRGEFKMPLPSVEADEGAKLIKLMREKMLSVVAKSHGLAMSESGILVSESAATSLPPSTSGSRGLS